MPRRSNTANITPLPSQMGTDKWKNLHAGRRRQQVSPDDVEPKLWVAAVTACLEDGVALLVARTSDGGAIMLQVLDGNLKPKLYAADSDELAEALQLLVTIANA